MAEYRIEVQIESTVEEDEMQRVVVQGQGNSLDQCLLVFAAALRGIGFTMDYDELQEAWRTWQMDRLADEFPHLSDFDLAEDEADETEEASQ